MSKKVPWYLSLWDEGKYIDFWSVNHTLAGVLAAGVAVYFEMALLISLVIWIPMMIAWECFEMFKHIQETPQNRVSDVVVGLLGFLVMYFLVNQGVMEPLTLYWVVGTLAPIVLCLNLWGMWASFQGH